MSSAVRGLGDGSTVIRLTRADCLSGLTRDELSLVRSLGMGRRIDQVVERSDLPAPVVLGLIASLYERNVITRVQRPQCAAAASQPPQAPIPTPPAMAVSGAARAEDPGERAALAEVNDLDLETRRTLLEMASRVASSDLFHVLGLPRAAEPSAVKRRYYELCRRFHPDRFAGKALGSFQHRIEAIFARLSEAQATLTNPERRAQYLARFPEPARPQVSGAQAQGLAEARRQRLRRHPFMRQQLQRAQLVSSGRQAFLKGDFLRACLDLEAAEKLGALDQETERWLAEARLKSPRKRT